MIHEELLDKFSTSMKDYYKKQLNFIKYCKKQSDQVELELEDKSCLPNKKLALNIWRRFLFVSNDIIDDLNSFEKNKEKWIRLINNILDGIDEYKKSKPRDLGKARVEILLQKLNEIYSYELLKKTINDFIQTGELPEISRLSFMNKLNAGLFGGSSQKDKAGSLCFILNKYCNPRNDVSSLKK